MLALVQGGTADAAAAEVGTLVSVPVQLELGHMHVAAAAHGLAVSELPAQLFAADVAAELVAAATAV